VAFFDTHYFANKSLYRLGVTYTFDLGGVAYSASCVNGEKIGTHDQAALERIYEVLGEEAPRDSTGNILPMTYAMDTLAALLPRQGKDADICEYQCQVEELHEFELDGLKIYQVWTTFLRTEPEMRGVLYLTERVLPSGYTPEVVTLYEGFYDSRGFMSGKRQTN
jgi:hypothetical protein